MNYVKKIINIFKKKKIVLVLGGGGARGLAHIGLLRAFEEANIKFDAIVGTSIGAIVGGMYAQNNDSMEIEYKFRKFFESEEFKKTDIDFLYSDDSKENTSFIANMFNALKQKMIIGKTLFFEQGFFPFNEFKSLISNLVMDMDFSELSIKFACVTSDLMSGKAVIFTEGKCLEPITASATIPGVIQPLNLANRLLVDGAVVHNIPIIPAKELFPDAKILGVSVNSDLKPTSEFDNTLKIILRVDDMRSYHRDKLEKSFADFCIHMPVEKFHWADFRHIDKFIELGYSVTKKFIEDGELI